MRKYENLIIEKSLIYHIHYPISDIFQVGYGKPKQRITRSKNRWLQQCSTVLKSRHTKLVVGRYTDTVVF